MIAKLLPLLDETPHWLTGKTVLRQVADRMDGTTPIETNFYWVW